MYEKTIEPVAIMHTGFGEKFGIPRQSGLVPEAAGQIVFESKYQNPDALRGIEEFTHLWIIWGFSENRVEKFTPLVTPPRLGGREKRGVFATRSPFRPNGMGLSSVRLDKVEYKSSKGPIIHVVEGIAVNKGLVVEEPGRRFEKVYKEHLWESYNKYSHEDTEILIEVQPKYVEVWDTSDDGYAFQLFIDFENKTVEPKNYDKK